MPASPYQRAVAVLQQRTGIVISVYFPEEAGTTDTGLLVETVHAFLREVEDPRSICLSVDGTAGPGAAAARELGAQCGVRVVVSETNHGKLHAVRQGMACLLNDGEHELLAVADQDGDHFANELLNFVRTVQHTQEHAPTQETLVLGRRISRHRPMGFLRGELEELADRVTLDALHYDAAVTGVPLRLEFANVLDEYPDFHSGYKLFTRPTAQAVFTALPNLCGVPETCYYRHACEAVMSVEALKAGAVLAVVNRSTFDEQPMSTFGLLNRQRLVADKMVWPCRRLRIPAPFADQWLRNHIPRLLLGSLAPEGKAELGTIKGMVLDALGDAETGPALAQPRFL